MDKDRDEDTSSLPVFEKQNEMEKTKRKTTSSSVISPMPDQIPKLSDLLREGKVQEGMQPFLAMPQKQQPQQRQRQQQQSNDVDVDND
eukprot:4428400-Ditylum_brightwellii.AAC.1